MKHLPHAIYNKEEMRVFKIDFYFEYAELEIPKGIAKGDTIVVPLKKVQFLKCPVNIVGSDQAK